MKRVVFFSFWTSCFFFFLNLLNTGAFFYLGIVGLLLSVFFLSEKEMFLLISFLVPNLFMFKQIGSKSAILGYFFLFVSIKFWLQNYKGKVRVRLYFLTHIVLTVVTCLIYSDMDLLIQLIRFCFNFSLFAYCATLFSCEGEIECVVKSYFAGTITAILMGIIYRSAQGTLYNGLFGGINSGRNYFGAIISPAITIAVLYFLEKKVSVSDVVLYGATTVLCLISIILSGSRTSVLGLIVPVMLILYSGFLRRNMKIFPLLVIIAVLVYYVYRNYFDSIMRLLERFGDEDVKTGNNRFDLWRYYIAQTFKNPVSFLFGSGSINKTSYVEHNTVVQCLYQLGIINSVLMLGILHYTFRRILRGNKIRLIALFPLLSIVVPYCGINGLYADQLSYLIILCAMIARDFSKPKGLYTVNSRIV